MVLNGFGGVVLLLVVFVNYLEMSWGYEFVVVVESVFFELIMMWGIVFILSILIGVVILIGSFVVVGKLMGKLGDFVLIGMFKVIVKVCFVLLIVGFVYFVVFNFFE